MSRRGAPLDSFARAFLVCVVALAGVLVLAGCNETLTLPKRAPKVKPPVIAKAGELRVALDLDYPPFGGVDKGDKAGLDIDVASAIADRLGLKLVIVEGSHADALKKLADRDVDVVMGGLTFDQALSDNLAFAGAYAEAAPVLFSSKPATVTLDDLGGIPVAVQKNAPAYWSLLELYGEDLIRVQPTLREALQSVESGDVEYAAGDSLVGSYILRDFTRLRLVGQIAPSTPIGVAVNKENPELENVLRSTLDQMSAEGVLGTLRRKWVGDLPDMGASSEETTNP